MNHINGNYTEDGKQYKYVCRVFPYSVKNGLAVKFIDGVGNEVPVQDTDIFKLFGDGTWFALYREDIDALNPKCKCPCGNICLLNERKSTSTPFTLCPSCGNSAFEICS